MAHIIGFLLSAPTEPLINQASGPPEEFGSFISDDVVEVDNAFYDIVWPTTQPYWDGEKVVVPTDGYLQRIDQSLIDDLIASRAKTIALAKKLLELETERNRRSDALVGTSDGRKKDKTISRAVKLLLRKVDLEKEEEAETISASDQQKLDDARAELSQVKALDDNLDAIYDAFEMSKTWLEDESRTFAEITSYDVTVDPGWSS